jgi:hypothetical protein
VVLQANAQTNSNTIVNDNSSWATLSYGVGYDDIHHEDILCCVETQYAYFEGDSTNSAVSYKKVFSSNDILHENIKYEGLIREQDKKTYFISANSEIEYLLYDFSLAEGMNFEYIDPRQQTSEPILFYVKKVDFIEINNVQKKRIQLAIVSFPYDENAPIRATWIENIGSLNGLFYPCNVLAPGGFRTLLCYHQNNELIYKNPAYSECYYDKAEDITSVQTIVADNYRIFPNPVDDILNISCLDNTILRVEIFDNLGRQVYSQPYKDKINISSLSKGLYLLKVYDTNEQISIFKIIKK